MSTKKIAAGDTLTVGDLTDDHLGAVIEVGPLEGITHRFRLDRVSHYESGVVTMLTEEGGGKCAHRRVPVTVITPPPVVQPDEPTALGQCIRIEGYDEWRALVADPGAMLPIRDVDGEWLMWSTVLKFAGNDQILVSDPPRWPDETPEVPERIEVGEWPDDDTHLREWVWVEDHHDGFIWIWYEADEHGPAGWRWRARGVSRPMPNNGPWTRGERVE